MKRTELFPVPVISVTQPIGTFYVTSMAATKLRAIAHADVRRMETSSTQIEQYVGIQRKLDPTRLKEIADYVRTLDATFPSSVVIAVEDERSIELSGDKRTLTFYEVQEDFDGPAVPESELARIIDGQHRVKGLEAGDVDFEVPVTVFPSLDIADQAAIFATVNLNQTKVSRSLVYDLFSFSKSRSPEKTCHNVVVSLNRAEGSPFFESIKRLGSATPGVHDEVLTQATFVQSLLPYVALNPKRDREDIRRGFVLGRASANDIQATPFRNFFLAQEDERIAAILWAYFDSIRKHWPAAWASTAKGQILRRTNGFRGFMAALRRAYFAVGGNGSNVPRAGDYERIWQRSSLTDASFTTATFLPGSSGQKTLTRELESAINIFRTKGKNASA